MKNLFFFLLLIMIGIGCGSNNQSDKPTASAPKKVAPKKADDGKGIGEIKNVTLNNPLDANMITSGKAIYEMKCAACHKLTDQRIVGPGWAGVTKKRKPEWIMNMTTNVEVMLDKDPEAYALLKECLVRMPNQNLSVGDARNVLEFMYDNDSGK
jgi:cytochrome c